MGNAGICPRCGGVGTVWTGGERIRCPQCGGSGVLQPARLARALRLIGALMFVAAFGLAFAEPDLYRSWTISYPVACVGAYLWAEA